MNASVSRRQFFFSSALAAGALALPGCASLKRPRRLSANDKIAVGVVGCGGKGWEDFQGVAAAGGNIVALCDIDAIRLEQAAKKFPDAKTYTDYRRMLDEVPQLDAVTVSTPDHHHFPAAMRAISRGCHVYVQKPLAHSVWEARQLTLAARKHGVATQMGNQGTSGVRIRELCELIWSGAIGHVTEVHVWTDRPIWPQGKDRPVGADPVPKHIDWERWLGPAPARPYKHRYPDEDRDVYHPFCWRGWWDFGTGALGDIACHAMNAPMWALKLGAPDAVEVVETAEVKAESFPRWSVLRWDFPARGELPPVKMFWYDGGKLPPLPPEMERRQWDNSGLLYVGDKGKIYNGRLLPESRMKDFQRPAPSIPRIENEDHYADWLAACRGQRVACSNFDFAGPLTETVLLGNVALRTGRRIAWDATHLRVRGDAAATALLRRDYRPGWV